MDRLQEISTNFTENRDYHYRRQLQALQRDVNLITYAEPYRNQPLDELVDDLDDEVSMSAAGVRGGQYGGTIAAGERQPKAGKWGRRFIEEVNNAMEDRDAHLALIVVSLLLTDLEALDAAHCMYLNSLDNPFGAVMTH